MAAYDYAAYVADGVGCEANPAAAVAWFKLAAEQEVDLAEFAMGNLYYYGENGVAKDTAVAEAMLRRAASHGGAVQVAFS
jgi:TPR repeat protein